jgi:hypothetical protein
VGVIAVVLRVFYRADVNLMVNLVMTLIITGVMLFGFGLVGELVAGLREEQRELARRLQDRRD